MKTLYNMGVTVLSIPVKEDAVKFQRVRNRMVLLWAALKPVLGNIGSVPLTVAGFACVAVGVFIACPIAGWIITGLLLILLEYLVADGV